MIDRVIRREKGAVMIKSLIPAFKRDAAKARRPLTQLRYAKRI